MFGRIDFREDGKKMRESDEIKLFEECWVGRGERKMIMGPYVFSPGPPKSSH